MKILILLLIIFICSFITINIRTEHKDFGEIVNNVKIGITKLQQNIHEWEIILQKSIINIESKINKINVKPITL